MHKTFEEIRALIREADEQVEVGGKYRHSKSGTIYIVDGFTILEETDELAVKYSPEGVKDVEFTRHLGSFIETVVVAGVAVPRFEKVV